MTDGQTYLALILAAGLAGAVNALAGGGTLLTFPPLIHALGSSTLANGTSTVALMPGSLASAGGYRRELWAARRWVALLILPSLIGGLAGALLVTRMAERYFDQLVPWLILTATLLMLAQPLFSRLARPEEHAHADPPRSPGMRIGLISAQFLIAVYGGYFGAGIGILMLGTLGVMGLHDIHEMNAVKTLLAAGINLMAAAVFIFDGYVNWTFALSMMAASIAGGYLGARFGRKLNRELVRWLVIAIGFALAFYYFAR